MGFELVLEKFLLPRLMLSASRRSADGFAVLWPTGAFDPEREREPPRTSENRHDGQKGCNEQRP